MGFYRGFRFSILSLFILFSWAISSCTRPSPPTLEQSIARSWQYLAITDSTGQVVKKVGESDFLKLTLNGSDKSFSYVLELEGIAASGVWELKDSVLTMTYAADLKSLEVDSAVYQSDGLAGSMEVFSSGSKVGEVNSKGMTPVLKSRNYRILELTDRKLVFTEDGITFKYQYTPPVNEGAISLMSIGRGLIGLAVLILICFTFSVNRSKIQWKLVLSGLLLQIVIAVGVLKVDIIKDAFEIMGNFFVVILSFTLEGSKFVFGDMVNPSGSIGFVFAFQILPTIIFFSALTSLLFYLGVLQKIVFGLAWVMSKTMKLSGAESLAAAANVFVGQTEAPLVVKPYIAGMTRSELMCLMTGGMATIAGGVMAAYIGFLGGDDPAMRLFFAKHLLAASIMSAPAAIVASKLLMPQTENVDKSLSISKEKIGKNVLEALSIGTSEGLKLAVNVGAMLLVFIAVMAMANYILKDFLGDFTGLNTWVQNITDGRYDGLTLQFLLGYIGAPLVWLLGVCKEDMVLVGQLLGEKTILNEFVAYASLGQMKFAGAFTEEKSIIMATYILCGFANFASIGIQIGGIGALAPNQRTSLSELGFRALLGGTVACLLTAVIVGMLI